MNHNVLLVVDLETLALVVQSTRYLFKGHLSVPIDQRMYLLDLFAENGVDSIFSGHVHFENLSATEYKGIHQYMLTSINWQMTWFSLESGTIWGPSEQSYYKINVRDSEIYDVRPIHINERRAPLI